MVVDKVGGYMIGNIAISLFAGVSAFICLELVGVPFALPVAVAIADLIPMIGATLGAVICLLVSVLTVGIWPRSVIVLAFFINPARARCGRTPLRRRDPTLAGRRCQPGQRDLQH